MSLYNNKKLKGFTLIEIVIAIAIAAILVPAVISLFVNSTTNSSKISNRADAVNQIKNVVNYVTQDTQMAGWVATTVDAVHPTQQDFPITLSWINYPTDEVTVTYTIINGVLQRQYYLNNELQSTMNIAQNVRTGVGPDGNKYTYCQWTSTDFLIIHITISKGGVDETREFHVTPRVIQRQITNVTPTVAVISSLNPSTIGGTVTFTAAVSPGAATGAITFKDNGSPMGVPVTITGNPTTYTTNSLSAGSHIITAVYSGDANYAPATSPPYIQFVGTAVTPTVTDLSIRSGPIGGGTTFTITGTGFITGATVNFVGSTTSAPGTRVIVNPSTQITVTSPPWAGTETVDVEVSIPDGAGGTLTSIHVPADQFTYSNAPVVTNISPSSGPIAGGTSVTITGSGFVVGGTTVKIGGVLVSGIAVNVSGTAISLTTPLSSDGSKPVVVTTAGGDDALPHKVFTYYGPAAQLAFVQQPSGATGANAVFNIQPSVAVQDVDGNTVTSSTASITIAKGTGSPSGTLSATTNPLSASGGIAAFAGVKINGTGNGYTLTATATINGSAVSVTSNPFNITGAATKLAFTTQPGGAIAGSAFVTQPVVTVQDAGNNTVTAYVGNITLTIGTNPVGGTLSGATTVPASFGVAAYSGLSIDLAGNGYVLTATSGSLTANSTLFNVSSAPAKLVFITPPAGASGGTAFTTQPVIAVQDANGNTVTASNAQITIAIGANPSSGMLSGTLKIIAVNGLASFSGLSIDHAGTGYTLTASSYGLTGGTSTAFNVAVGPAVKLAFTTQPSGATGANVVFTVQPVVTVQDAGGNTVTSSNASVTLAKGSGSPSGTLTVTTNPLSASGGIASFSGLKISATGNGFTLTATSGSLAPATSSQFNITGSASKLAFSIQPGGAVAGSVFAAQPVVIVQDLSGNIVTASNASIIIAIGTNPSGGVISGTATITATYGIATFTGLSIDKAGNGYTLTATSTPLTGAPSNTFNVTGSPAKLAFTTQPSGAVAGIAFTTQPVVLIQDASGNTVTASSASVSISIATGPSGSSISGILTATAVNGVATFNGLSINLIGTYTLAARSAGLTQGTSSAFPVTLGAAYQLAFTKQPAGAISGSPFGTQPNVTIQDASGNTVPTSGIPVTIAIGNNPSSGTISGTLTVNTNSSGVAMFTDLNIKNFGVGYTLMATSPGLVSSFSNAFTVAKRSITVTAAANTKIYDATTSAFATPLITTGSLATGDTANFTETYDTDNVGTGKTLTPSGTVSDGNSGNNYAITFVNDNTGVVTAKALTVTGLSAGNKVYDGSTTATITGTGSLVGVVSGAVSLSGTPIGTFAGKNVGTGVSVTVSGLSLTGTSAGNYTLTQPTLSANITAKALTVTGLSAGNKVYDGSTTATITGTGSLVGVVSGDTVSLSGTPTGTFADRNVGTGKTVSISGLTISGASASNYTLTQPATTANITARPISVTANTNTKTYDGTTSAAAVPTITAGNLISGDTATWTETYDTANAGTGKTLTPTGTVNDGNGGNNYAITFINNTTGVINKASSTASLSSSLNPSAPGESVTFTATVTPGTATGTVTFKDGSNTLSTVALSSGQATYTTSGLSSGSHSITAVYNGDTNYSTSTSSTLTQTVRIRCIGAGTAAAGTGNVTPGLPSGWAQNDIFLLFVESANQAVATPAGWAIVSNSPQGTGTAGGNSATRLSVFWKRAAASETAPTVTDPGNHAIAQILAFRGCVTSGNPWDTTAGDVLSSSSTSVSIPGATTSVNNCLIVLAVANMTDTTSSQTTGFTNANLTNLTEITDNNTNSGNGGGIGIAAGSQATAGNYGATSATLATASLQGRISIALKPAN